MSNSSEDVLTISNFIKFFPINGGNLMAVPRGQTLRVIGYGWVYGAPFVFELSRTKQGTMPVTTKYAVTAHQSEAADGFTWTATIPGGDLMDVSYVLMIGPHSTNPGGANHTPEQQTIMTV
jgi:hypothetical protein